MNKTIFVVFLIGLTAPVFSQQPATQFLKEFSRDRLLVTSLRAEDFLIEQGAVVASLANQKYPIKGTLKAELVSTIGNDKVVWTQEVPLEIKDVNVFSVALGGEAQPFVDDGHNRLTYDLGRTKIDFTFTTQGNDVFKRPRASIATAVFAQQAQEAFEAKGKLEQEIIEIQKRLESKDAEVRDLKRLLLDLYTIVNGAKPEKLVAKQELAEEK